MTSYRDRRAAARARLEREMALRAESAQRRRKRQSVIAGTAAAVVLVGVAIWVIVAIADDDGGGTPAAGPSASASASPTTCAYRPLIDPSQSPSPTVAPSLPAGVKEVGMPDSNVPRSGKQVMTITTNQGVIKIEMDLSKVPCTAGSFAYLASKNFFDNTECHRLVPTIGALQCGDPTGDGTGGPAYRFGDENLPVNRRPAYPEGVVAMANAGVDTNGSQFFFVYKDSDLQAQYTIIGKVTEGLDVVKKVAEGGHDGAYDPDPGGGKPKTKMIIQSLTVSAPTT